MLFDSDVPLNPLKPNDPYSGRTSPLTSKRCILYIYSTNIGTEYFKRVIYSPFFPLQNAVCFIILTYLVSVLFTFCIQCVLKLKKNNSGAKRLLRTPYEHSDTTGSLFPPGSATVLPDIDNRRNQQKLNNPYHRSVNLPIV